MLLMVEYVSWILYIGAAGLAAYVAFDLWRGRRRNRTADEKKAEMTPAESGRGLVGKPEPVKQYEADEKITMEEADAEPSAEPEPKTAEKEVSGEEPPISTNHSRAPAEMPDRSASNFLQTGLAAGGEVLDNNQDSGDCVDRSHTQAALEPQDALHDEEIAVVRSSGVVPAMRDPSVRIFDSVLKAQSERTGSTPAE